MPGVKAAEVQVNNFCVNAVWGPGMDPIYPWHVVFEALVSAWERSLQLAGLQVCMKRAHCLPGGLKKDVVTCNAARAVNASFSRVKVFISGFATADELAACLAPLALHGHELIAAQCYKPQQLHPDGVALAVSWSYLLKDLGTKASSPPNPGGQ